MSERVISRPAVTVATIVERDGRFLFVEEETRAGRKINQPAGHLESGESLPAAAVRETLEETAWSVMPTALVGIYRWEAADNGATFVRFTFCADARAHDPHRVLDFGIVAAVWLTYDEIVARRHDHRSPLVQRCIDDYRAGARWPLDFVKEVAVQRGFWKIQRLESVSVKNQRVVVGMSGGVDSSVAAWLLKQQGYDVVGVFMKNWEDDDTDEYCTSREDLVDAASVADVIGIELVAVNFAAQYRERVFAHFLREYEAGRTPNPDVLCNSEIKFAAFLDHALALGATRIATGHYARVRTGGGGVELLKATDASKDQSYFLHRLTQRQLAPVMFPLGEMRKRDVRAIAQREGIPTYAKKDSTGICFIGERPFRDFLARYLPRTPGPLVTPEGDVVGEHQGIAYYTLGQRQGLRIGGIRQGVDAPWFVAAKDVGRNAIVVVQGHDHPALYRRTVEAIDAHWIAGHAPALPHRFGAKTRYRMPDAPCFVSASAGGCVARFDEPQWAPTPGQYLVVYDGEACLGGGVIAARADIAADFMAAPAAS